MLSCQGLGCFTYSLLLSIRGQTLHWHRPRQHQQRLRSRRERGGKLSSFSKSPFLKPDSALAQGLLWLPVLRMSPRRVGLTEQRSGLVNPSH